MFVTLPGGKFIDLSDLPKDFEKIVKEDFQRHTRGTRAEYRFVDKLGYLDGLRFRFHGAVNSSEAVRNLIKEQFSYELDHHAEIMDKDDFYDIGFMEECYDAGFLPMKGQFSEKERENEEIQKVLLRIVQIVVNLEEEQKEANQQWTTEK